jgi:hypothetical protein
MGRPITKEQKDYLITHLNDRPRRAVARAAGVSMDTMYKIVHQHEGILLREGGKTKAKDWEIVVREYPHLSSGEIAKKYGINKSLVIRCAASLGLKHTEETKERLREQQRNRCRLVSTPEVVEKRHKKRAKTVRMELFNIKSGMPQKTKLHFCVIPKRVHFVINYLVRRRNYFRDIEVGGRFTLYYDEQTKRSGKEDYYTKSCGLTFEQVRN